MPTINSKLTVGTAVRSTGTGARRLHRDFPGWGDATYSEFISVLPRNVAGVVTNVEHHGINPWTRYCVRWADGSRSSGLVPGGDFTVVAP